MAQSSSGEALQALLNSLKPNAGDEHDTLTPEQVKRLANKLDELVGQGLLDGHGQSRNERDERVNEEGLPIVEITEQAPDSRSTPPGEPPESIEEPNIIPLASLSAEERLRMRIERDRLLDMLEEEERREQRRGPELTREQKEEILQKRKEAAQVEAEKLKKSKALQKKMGKALLRGLAHDREKEGEKTRKQSQTPAVPQKKERKTVSFADLPPEKSSKAKQETTPPPAQPMTIGSIPRVHAKGGQLPMKMQVIERFPTTSAVARPLQTSNSSQNATSLPNLPTESEPIPIGTYNVPSNSQASPQNRDQGFDTDTDFAQEIATEYFKKRGTIGEQASKAIAPSHDHHASSNGWNQPEVPLEATLSSPPPKPAISRFRSGRLANSPTASTSLGSSILPVSSAQTLQRAVRVGKLQGDQLVGADDSNSDNDEGIQKSLEILRNNTIPEVQTDRNTTQHPDQPVPAIPETVRRQGKQKEQTFHPRFTSLRSGLQHAPSPTKQISHTERSSQKPPSAVEDQFPSESERVRGSSASASSNSSPHLTDKLSRAAVIDASRSTTVPSTVIDSPSFPSPANLNAEYTKRPPGDQRQPVMTSIVRESGAVADRPVLRSCPDPISLQRVSRFKAERS